MDGVLLIDKPAGITSYGVVERIKRKIKKKVGHSGTLDPQATGLLIILVGRATKMASHFHNFKKEYLAKAKFGLRTNTQDIWGKIESKKPVNNIKKEDIEKIIPEFTGEIEQLPPMVSALWHQGTRLYKLARKGITVERKKRKVIIYKLKLLNFKEGEYPEAEFDIICSSGTYIRTLISDIGERMGTGAVMNYLRRIRIGEFKVEEAVGLKEFLDSVAASAATRSSR